MTTHLTDQEIAAAVAGGDLDQTARDHLADCVSCRTEVTDFHELVDSRRAQIAASEPDWPAMAGGVLDRLAALQPETAVRRPRWLRPVLAMAATVVIAVGIGLLLPDRHAPQSSDELAVEEILAEMDELLADDSIPGFEAIDPGTEELSSLIDNGAS
jgi:hypothetical protein